MSTFQETQQSNMLHSTSLVHREIRVVGGIRMFIQSSFLYRPESSQVSNHSDSLHYPARQIFSVRYYSVFA